MTSESTRWPLLEERTRFVTATLPAARRKPPRSVWLLTGLAFLCGGLISAAGFSIGWRHQAQHDTATQAALAAATARGRALERALATTRRAEARQQQAAAAAAASQQSVIDAAAKVRAQATASQTAASVVSSGAGTITASAGRIASELKTLETYLSSTPAGQLDPGYIASQTAYLTRQLTKLQRDGGTLGGSVAAFESAIGRLTRSAAGLSPP